ncbi:hypothetical protein SLE2022_346690 [Rubroshorea leprosula]
METPKGRKRRELTGTGTVDPGLPENLFLDDKAGPYGGDGDHSQNESFEIAVVHLYITPIQLHRLIIFNIVDIWKASCY